jgi:membrane protein implicated in regulation of membrane protease activity
METWFITLTGTDRFFLTCAAAGAAGVLLRLKTQVLGFAGGDMAAGDHGDMGSDPGGADSHHFDGFKIISVHGLAAFFLMFGLVGLAMNRESRAPMIASILAGVIAGAVSVWIITKLFQMANKLQSVGNLDLGKAAGSRGTVYMQIPKGASGRVMLSVDGRQREMDAVSVSGEAMPTGAPVVVVRLEENMAVVDFLR